MRRIPLSYLTALLIGLGAACGPQNISPLGGPGDATAGQPGGLANPPGTDPNVTAPTGSIVPGTSATLENGYARLSCDLKAGTCDVIDKVAGATVVTAGAWQVSSFKSSDAGVTHNATLSDANDVLGAGKTLRIDSSSGGKPTLSLVVTAYAARPGLVLGVGATNNTGAALQIKSWHALVGGQVMKGGVLSNPKTLNGASGGRETTVQSTAARDSTNNLLLAWTDGSGNHSLTAGGLTYHDWIKSVTLAPLVAPDRQAQIAGQLSAGGKVLAYLDAGEQTTITQNGVTLAQTQGGQYTFSGHDAPGAFYSMAVDGGAVRFTASGLPGGQAITMGFSWWDFDNNGRTVSVTVGPDANNQGTTLVPATVLPAFQTRQQLPQQMSLAIPASAIANGTAVISFNFISAKKAGSNSLVSEVWVAQGTPNGQAAPPTVPSVNSNITLDLSATDPVGKLVDNGSSYLPDDRFYLDVSTANPFDGLDAYGERLRVAQNVNPNPYDFATLCSWYAGVWTTPGAENSPANSKYQLQTSAGQVAEMQVIKNSGFLSYGRMVLRLVPDTYADNNMNGWYDDAHYQQYGFFTSPYLTAMQWGQAIRNLGGMPGIYMQPIVQGSAGISADFRQGHTNLLLGGNVNRSLDYTNPATLSYLAQVFANFKAAGVATLMLDFNDDLWVKAGGGAPGELAQGGFYDTHATAAQAYRAMFQTAKTGLGTTSWLHERGIDDPGSDVTLGIVDSQRTQWDSTTTSLGLIAKSGLRWYKNRVLVAYDMDAHDLTLGWKRPDWVGTDSDGLRMLLTMSYVSSSRMLLANSFRDMPAATIADLEKTIPYHSQPKSARPVDAFSNALPSVYDFAVDANWHQVTLLNNTSPSVSSTLSVPMGTAALGGGLGLDGGQQYYAYDFWNDTYMGKVAGNGSLQATLRAGEARMISLHRVEANPQFISTSRHLMQGYVDLSDLAWDPSAQTLTGHAKGVGGAATKIVLALNGYSAVSATASQGSASTAAIGGTTDVVALTLTPSADGDVKWVVTFKR